MFVITAYELTGNPLHKLPEGWNEVKMRRVVAHYEDQTESEAVLEDEAGIKSSETVVSVPHEFVPKVREIIDKSGR